MQHGVPCIWALVDTDNENEYIYLNMVGTGHQIDDISNKEFISTFQVENGNFVFHLFKDINKKALENLIPKA